MSVINNYLVDGKYSIKDLIDMDMLRQIFEKFTLATGYTIGFLDHPAMEVLVATGWKDICTKFHRNCPESLENCNKSNKHLLDQLTEPGKLIVEECDNGLVDCATPIIIKGKHVASLATGQLLLAEPDVDRFKKQAKIFGLDEKEYLEALKEVEVFPEEEVKKVTAYLGEMAVVISKLGYANLEIKENSDRLKKEIEERKKAEERLSEYKNHLEDLVEERTQELKNMQEKLIKVEKLAAIGKLAGSIAHELRNPMNTVKSSVYFLDMKLKDINDEKIKKHLDIINEEIRSSDKIVTDILNFARTKPPICELSDINKIVKSSIEKVGLKQSIVVVLDLGSDIPEVFVDSAQIGQVFTNIISNAVDAMHGNGNLTVKSSEDKDFVCIEFDDTGEGIDSKDIDKIFEPLFSTKAKGIGFGLPICQTIVQLHGGTIEVESAKNKGTKFRIKLPKILLPKDKA